MAPAQLSYTKAQVSPIAKLQEDRTNFFDWKNKPDKGAGISHFLWKEKAKSHQTEVRENEIKYWNAADRKAWQQEETCLPKDEK